MVRLETAPILSLSSDMPDNGALRRKNEQSQQHPLERILADRIAIIDGAMGTTIRTYGMTEADIRGERFKDSKKDLLNNGDLFSLTQPKMIGDIHRRFLEAGADIIETNTFGATSITQSEFFVDDPREHGGRKDPAFYQKIIEDEFLSSWPGRSTSSRRGSAGSGPIAWPMKRAGSALWPEPWGRSRCRFRIRPTPMTRAFAW